MPMSMMQCRMRMVSCLLVPLLLVLFSVGLVASDSVLADPLLQLPEGWIEYADGTNEYRQPPTLYVEPPRQTNWPTVTRENAEVECPKRAEIRTGGGGSSCTAATIHQPKHDCWFRYQNFLADCGTEPLRIKTHAEKLVPIIAENQKAYAYAMRQYLRRLPPIEGTTEALLSSAPVMRSKNPFKTPQFVPPSPEVVMKLSDSLGLDLVLSTPYQSPPSTGAATVRVPASVPSQPQASTIPAVSVPEVPDEATIRAKEDRTRVVVERRLRGEKLSEYDQSLALTPLGLRIDAEIRQKQQRDFDQYHRQLNEQRWACEQAEANRGFFAKAAGALGGLFGLVEVQSAGHAYGPAASASAVPPIAKLKAKVLNVAAPTAPGPAAASDSPVPPEVEEGVFCSLVPAALVKQLNIPSTSSSPLQANIPKPKNGKVKKAAAHAGIGKSAKNMRQKRRATSNVDDVSVPLRLFNDPAFAPLNSYLTKRRQDAIKKSAKPGAMKVARPATKYNKA